MIVAKFGGGVLNSADGLRRVRDEIVTLPRPLLVVTSAFAHVTNELEAIATAAVTSETEARRLLGALVESHRTIAREVFGDTAYAAWTASIAPLTTRLDEVVRGLAIMRELSPRTMDLVVSFGERFSSELLIAALNEAGASTRGVTATDVIITDTQHRFARPNIELTAERVRERLAPQLRGNEIVVTEGYIARSVSGETTTMGRESSNYSATLLAELTHASEVRIYTAVPGILTADPHLVDDARTIAHLSYGAAQTLAELGARVLHPRAVTPAERAGIPIVIRSFDGEATTIDAAAHADRCSIALLPESSLITVVAPAVSTSDDAFVAELSAHSPLVWRTRFRRRLQFVTASRIEHAAIPVASLEGGELSVTHGAVVSVVQQAGVNAHDLARFFGVIGDRETRAILGGVDRHAVGAFVDADDALPIVRDMHARFVASADAS
jgi:aspartate kinase